MSFEVDGEERTKLALCFTSYLGEEFICGPPTRNKKLFIQEASGAAFFQQVRLIFTTEMMKETPQRSQTRL